MNRGSSIAKQSGLASSRTLSGSLLSARPIILDKIYTTFINFLGSSSDKN